MQQIELTEPVSWIVRNLWLIPFLPLLAAGLIALASQSRRRFAQYLSIGAMTGSFLLSLCALATCLAHHGERLVHNVPWFDLGRGSLTLGWIVDPLTASMLVMVTLVGTLIFIYSVGYMAHDRNVTRFFGFLSLFAAAMLGLVIANNLLLLFMSWELVGLASYLLIGFWYHKPSAAAAATKAFLTTRIGDVFFLLGMVWLYGQTGTLLFYDDGAGCLEQSALTRLVGLSVGGGMMASTAIGLLIFCGAVGKSGQVPLHVWLPDAMEGPTPVSALIHAATMVAAGVFLVARVFPLLSALPEGVMPEAHGAPHTAALTVVTWVGAITAVFAALVAVAQNDIKRILAYSTVSQLGYMFIGLGTGGVAVGMFHLITHAFFKALLFMGAGSVIHGCHDEQDIRRMGGLRTMMPVTFATYAVGMMALSGVPLFFSGFWSKDEILHSASAWTVSRLPFWLGATGALLTAFYMTRQVCYVFFGRYRGGETTADAAGHGHGGAPHESPNVMTRPLVALAIGTVLLSLIGTPFWPWFHDFLSGHAEGEASPVGLDVLGLLLFSSVVSLGGIFLGYRFYGRRPLGGVEQPDPVERLQPDVWGVLRGKFYVDELYEVSVVRWNVSFARFADWLDRTVVDGAVRAVSLLVLAFSWVSRLTDEYLVNLGFDKGCESLRTSGRWLSLFQNGQVQRYLRVVGLAMAVLGLIFIWGCK